MATGQGKGITFLLPSWVCPEGLIIVVLPLLALYTDLEAKYRQYNIESV
jgi:superfamily II DNA helicase RecQ